MNKEKIKKKVLNIVENKPKIYGFIDLKGVSLVTKLAIDLTAKAILEDVVEVGEKEVWKETKEGNIVSADKFAMYMAIRRKIEKQFGVK